MLILGVSGCASGPSEILDSCKVFGPIRPTEGDMDTMSYRLVEQILRHNVTGEYVCGWLEKFESPSGKDRSPTSRPRTLFMR